MANRNNAQQSNKLKTTIQKFEKLIGKWKLSGDAQGQIEYRWLEGGFFLMQDVDIEYGGKRIRGIELIGHFKGVEEQPSKEVWSRFYSFLDGLTLNYVYDFSDNTLTIWFVEKDSNNFYKGIYSEDGNSFTGEWKWPGGGYKVRGNRIS